MNDQFTLYNDAEIALWSQVYVAVMGRDDATEHVNYTASLRADDAVYALRDRMPIDAEVTP